MSIKNQPKFMHKLIANDELLDAMDLLSSKITQCKTAGMSDDDIQSKMTEYLTYQCVYSSVTLRRKP